jgi:hypothetical protein
MSLMSVDSRAGLRCGLTATLVIGVLVVGASVWAAEVEPTSPAMISLEKHLAAGDLEYRDPSTGEIVVATRDRIDALRFDLERTFGQPPVYNETISANGAVVSVIGDAIRDVHLVRINLDGTRTTACLRNLDAAVAFIVGLDVVGNEAADNRPSAVSR